jgi:hypothetical protein
MAAGSSSTSGGNGMQQANYDIIEKAENSRS